MMILIWRFQELRRTAYYSPLQTNSKSLLIMVHLNSVRFSKSHYLSEDNISCTKVY